MYILTAGFSLLLALFLCPAAYGGQLSTLEATYLLLLSKKPPQAGPLCQKSDGDGSGNCSQIVGAVAGRMWMRADDGILRNFYDGGDYCDQLDYDGYDDWRLPSRVELEGLLDIDPNAPPPYIVTPLFVRTDAAYWSQDEADWGKVMGADFSSGTTMPYSSMQDLLYVRCVRTVQ